MATTIGIFAHVDAGKTTLSEQILFNTGMLRALGRVDEKNAYLDHDAIERARGITIFADEAPFSIGDKKFFLIDTPGHADFGGEMERSMCAIDCAVLVISAVEGIESHTLTVWDLLRKNKIPTVIFINKIDRAGADANAVLDAIKSRFSESAILFDNPDEELATVNDELLSAYLEADKSFDVLIKKAVLNCEVYPVIFGSALKGEGVDKLLEILEKYCYREYNAEGDFSALVYKVRHEKGSGRAAYLKILSGLLSAREVISTPDGDEKCGELKRISGGKSETVKKAVAGELVAAYGLSAKVGDTVGKGANREPKFTLVPLLSVRVSADKEVPVPELLGNLRELEDEEPLYHIAYNAELSEIHIQVMGEIQLEILKSVMQERFGIEITYGECEVVYKETILQPVYGFGHYEPLRHYSEVHFRLEPNPGRGIEFESEVSQDVFGASWQRLIRTHIFEKTHRGVLVGAPIEDVKIVLIAGKAHEKHTEGGDFREATYRGIRQGLMKAKSVLLEPWLKFEIECEPSLTGRILTDIQTAGGEYDAPEFMGENQIIRGAAPAKMLISYARELIPISGGRARISLKFYKYLPCRDQDEVVKKLGYEAERDIENTADSIFCIKGAGVTIKWDKAEESMNLPLPKKPL